MTAATERADAVIIGGGPAGLATATALRRAGVGSVVVLEREHEAGGIPRHSDHTGFGLRDFHRVLRGPAYARRWVDTASRAGVTIRTATTATGWDGEHTLLTTSPHGVERIEATAIVLATGCRERPRPARLVPGDRPAGVLTTGSLQQLAARRLPVGRRAVIVGAEHVSMSAVLTLHHAGVDVIAMVTEHDHHQTLPPYLWGSVRRYRVPLLTRRGVTCLEGHERLERVILSDGTALDCDTVVFTGDWVPDHELARRGDLPIDAGTRAPTVDQCFRTQRPGVFAAGNLLHGAETADICALDGKAAATAVLDWLSTSQWPGLRLPLTADHPLRWVHPTSIVPDAGVPPGGHLLTRAAVGANGRLVVRQRDHILHASRRRTIRPNLPVRVTAGWIGDLDPAGGVVSLQLEER